MVRCISIMAICILTTAIAISSIQLVRFYSEDTTETYRSALKKLGCSDECIDKLNLENHATYSIAVRVEDGESSKPKVTVSDRSAQRRPVILIGIMVGSFLLILVALYLLKRKTNSGPES